jgi:hypothetical protein
LQGDNHFVVYGACRQTRLVAIGHELQNVVSLGFTDIHLGAGLS